MSMADPEQKVRELFAEHDKEGTGWSKEQLQKVFVAIGLKVSDGAIEDMLKRLSVNPDERIDTKTLLDYAYKQAARGNGGYSAPAAPAAEAPKPKGLAPGVAALRIIQVTDTYTLENFPSLKTMIRLKREEAALDGIETISMLTGDFLAPYLLASVDHGKGMMHMINETPIDYLTWGNHDGNDQAPDAVRIREAEYQGVWINSNMQEHETFANSKCQCDRAVVEVVSADKAHHRKIGLCAVLSNSPDLYRPNAFNGAKIEDPWETLRIYKDKLEKEDNCDLVIPLCHLYEPQDERTCREFDFPLILSGHDHHVVDKVVEGTRLLKPGQDARKAHIIDLSWNTADADCKPTIEVDTIDVTAYEKDKTLEAQAKQAYSVLDKLLYTGLYPVDPKFRPLTSFGSRNRNVTMGSFLCTHFRDALNHTHHSCQEKVKFCDCVLLKGANVRGGCDYPCTGPGSDFSLKSLLSETMEEHELFMFKVPGRCIKVGLRETWQQAGPGWFQYSDDVQIDDDGLVTHIAGEPLDEDRLYNVGSIKDLSRVADGPTIGEYLNADPSRLPSMDTGHPVRSLLMSYFAHRVWKEIFKALDSHGHGHITMQDIKRFDKDGDGTLDRESLKKIIRTVEHLRTSDDDDTFVDMILADAGDHGDHHLTVDQINEVMDARKARIEEKEKRHVLEDTNGRVHRRKSAKV